MKRWQLIQELFEEAVELDVEQRSRLLSKRTNGDEELASRVEALIAADETPLAAFGRSATDLLQELAEEPPAEDYELKLTYRARSSKGVRFGPGEGSVAALPLMLDQFNKTPIELIEPLDPQFADANPAIMRTIEASQWLNAHHQRSPVTRYGLQVLETLDAVDPAFDMFGMYINNPAFEYWARDPDPWVTTRYLVSFDSLGSHTQTTTSNFLEGVICVRYQ